MVPILLENGTYSARLLAATTLRNTLGKLNKIKPILSLQIFIIFFNSRYQNSARNPY
jgi:hypothetical protein